MSTMTEERVKKREWVKTAAIIFLSIMLVLTFFSNTFMNYSLPEVSTSYVSMGSINTKIRGSGTVMANEEYVVEIEQGRKIDTVCVKKGDTVNAGDVLFILGEADSDELEDLKDQLEVAEFEYEIAIIEASKEKYSNESKAVSEARKALDEAKDFASKVKEAEVAIASAEADFSAKTERYNELKNHLDKLEGAEETEEVKNLKILLAEAEKNRDAWKAKLDAIIDAASDEYKTAEANYNTWSAAAADYTAKLAELNVPNDSVSGDPNAYNELHNQYVAAEVAMNNADKKREEVKEKYGKYAEMSYATALIAVEEAEGAYYEARRALSEAMENGEIDEMTEEFNLGQQKKKIERLREKVAELSGGDSGKEIVAKMGGTVAEINVTAGQTALAGEPIAKIELSDKGYTTNITVTTEQAKKVSIGDTAEISTYWWGSQIKAVLKEIKNDVQSGGKNKVLIFELSGDIEPGMNVDVSIGQRSQNYDAIVPNSAVRTDSNGSFVLIISTKSSPLGNRYYATRVDVQVLATDDVNSAVSGISNGEYVITTASAPIEAGMLVRMAEG